MNIKICFGLKELEKQNAELKKHISEIVEGNDIDKQEAIDELREEYEQHVQVGIIPHTD